MGKQARPCSPPLWEQMKHRLFRRRHRIVQARRSAGPDDSEKAALAVLPPQHRVAEAAYKPCRRLNRQPQVAGVYGQRLVRPGTPVKQGSDPIEGSAANKSSYRPG